MILDMIETQVQNKYTFYTETTANIYISQENTDKYFTWPKKYDIIDI